MKPEKFDEAIRRKLEGIQPSFQDEDWAKFKAFKNTHAPVSFVQRFGRSMLYTAASVAAAVMVFANVYQYRQNQQLDQQVAKLKTQLGQKQDAPVRTSTRVDTVYITKYISVESNQPQPDAYAQTLPQSNENELSNDGIAPDDAAPIAGGLKNVGKIIRQNPNERISEAFERPTNADPAATEPKESTSTLENETPAKPVKNAFKEKITNSTFSKEKAGSALRTLKSQTTVAQSGSVANNKNAPKLEQSGIINVATEPTTPVETANNAVSSQIELSPLEPNQAEELDGVQPAEIHVKRYAYAALQNKSASSATPNEAKTTPPPPSISLQNVRFRVGGGLNIGDKYTGYGLMTSVLLGKYWSLDVGLAKAKITGPQYFTEDIFKAKTGRPFQTWHKADDLRPPLMPPQVFDIKTDVTLVRLPISLTYRWPIKDGFTLLFSGGTNLNLSAQQSYRFSYKERNDEFKEKEGNFSIKPAVSNDIMIATGVEKQWRSLAFQVEAYAAPYLQKPAYLTDNRNLGVRFKILYQFGKKQI